MQVSRSATTTTMPSILLRQGTARHAHADAFLFRNFFLRWSGALLGYVSALVDSRERAEEIVAGAFMDVYHRGADVADEATLHELYRLVTFTSLSSTSASARSNGAAHHDVRSRIHAALRNLPPIQRAAFLLGRVPRLEGEQIARWLDTSKSEVKELALDAARQLVEDLGDCLDGDDIEGRSRELRQ